jgi:hypothetical protein
MGKKVRVNRQREVRIHSELWHTSNVLFRAGKLREEGSAHQFRASLIFRAFAFEAFLNWLGPKLIPHWAYLERLTPAEKLTLLADIAGVKPDNGSRPWQTVKDLFSFRNALAHGKPENLTDEMDQDLNEYLSKMDFVQSKWEKFATEESAVRAQEDVSTIAENLYRAAKLKHDGFRGAFAFGSQMRRASL